MGMHNRLIWQVVTDVGLPAARAGVGARTVMHDLVASANSGREKREISSLIQSACVVD